MARASEAEKARIRQISYLQAKAAEFYRQREQQLQKITRSRSYNPHYMGGFLKRYSNGLPDQGDSNGLSFAYGTRPTVTNVRDFIAQQGGNPFTEQIKNLAPLPPKPT